MRAYPKHIVAAGALVSKEDKVLLVRTPRRGWEFPGGQIEEGEPVIQGLMRELREEAGIVVRITRLVGIYSNLGTPSKVMMDFLGEWESGELACSEETLEVEWVDRQQALARITHPGYRYRLQQLLSFSGQVVYQAYTNPPYEVHLETII